MQFYQYHAMPFATTSSHRGGRGRFFRAHSLMTSRGWRNPPSAVDLFCSQEEVTGKEPQELVLPCPKQEQAGTESFGVHHHIDPFSAIRLRMMLVGLCSAAGATWQFLCEQGVKRHNIRWGFCSLCQLRFLLVSTLCHISHWHNLHQQDGAWPQKAPQNLL